LVTRSKPAKVFLLIGINDLSHGISKDTVFANICKIAENIRSASPKTKVFIQSIFPVNASFGKFEKHVDKGEEVIFINAELKMWCSRKWFFLCRFVQPIGNSRNRFTQSRIYK